MIENDDSLINFYDEPVDAKKRSNNGVWKIIIADDDKEVHVVTRMVLSDFRFKGKGIVLLSAYSAKEAKQILSEHPDTAIILLDVVMEDDISGLNLVKYIRQELKNNFIRIILRTGQPGQAPETKVVAAYDINDYKEKTELTSQKLLTSIISGLRTFADMCAVEKSRLGLEKVVSTFSGLFELQSVENFAPNVLKWVCDILLIDQSKVEHGVCSFLASKEQDYKILSALGFFENLAGTQVAPTGKASFPEIVNEAISEELSIYRGNEYAGFFKTKWGHVNLIYVKAPEMLTDLDINLLKVFSANLAIAFDNLQLSTEIVDTQMELTYTLGEVIEKRSHETANHVRRVAEISALLAEKYGLSEVEIDLIRAASPLHDVGKIGIPDAILNKPGKLTSEEYDVIKTHPVIGYEILKSSNRPILKTAAIIAYQHQEKWDGTGYPQGLKAEEIHIFSRIVAVADVFDALGQKRVYKEAWDVDEIFNFMASQKNVYFEEKLVDILIDNKEEFLSILTEFPD